MTRFDAQEEHTEESESDQEPFGTDKNGEETRFDDLDDVSHNASTAELPILLESEHYSLGNLNDLPADFDSELVLFFDEPEPLAEYDSELGEPLYEINEDSIGDLTRELKIDQLVSFLDETTDEQRTQITKLLREFSNRKLRNWLVWLRNREWTGQSLQLFLTFFGHWYENCHWWECWYWDRRLGWVPGFSRFILSRDEAYQWVQRCPHSNPIEIIDKSWFEDWEFFELWQYGFDSFVSFVRFRFDFDDREDWRCYLGLDDDKDDKWWDDDTQDD